jgi:lysophospholipase L1-like esterase
MKKTALLIGLVALLGVAPTSAQDFSTYVALGDSLTAGFTNGGLGMPAQQESYAALLARQAGTHFELPLISSPGIPGMWTLASLATGSPQFYIPSQAEYGMPINATYPGIYNNLGVPGATLFDMLFTVGDISRVLLGTATSETIMFDLILRNNTNTALEQAIGLGPTFVTVWIGNNDALGAALAGTAAPGLTLTPVETFQVMYGNAIGALATNTDADIVVFTIGEGPVLPFVNTIPPVIVDPTTQQPVLINGAPVPLIGSNGPVSMDSLITLNAAPLLAQGIGIPVELGGTGLPLPDDLDIVARTPGVIIRPDEMQVILDHIGAYNEIIYAVADQFGARVFDVRPLYNQYLAEGVKYGGIDFTGDYLTGGIFGYDGIHQAAIGHADLAVHLIDFLNSEFGGSIPQVDVAEIMCAGGCGDIETPTPLGANAIDVFTAEARSQLMQILARKLVRPALTPGVSSDSGVRPQGGPKLWGGHRKP